VEAHERFEELSAAASIGEASGAELAELREHMAGCPACREAYSEFLQLSAVRTANGMSKQAIGGDEAIAYIDSALFRQKFLKRAEAEGVVFSHPKEAAELRVPQRASLKSRWNLSFALPLATACLLIGGLAGGYYWKVRETGRSARRDAKSTFASQPATSVRNEAADAAQEGAVGRLQEENHKLSSEVASLKSTLSQQAKNANQLEENAAASEKEHDVLASELKQRQARLPVRRRNRNVRMTAPTTAMMIVTIKPPPMCSGPAIKPPTTAPMMPTMMSPKTPYPLPLSLTIGDDVLIEGTGAYTTTYSAVAFNGFEPLRSYVI